MSSPLKKKAKIVRSKSIEEVVDSSKCLEIISSEWDELNLHPLTLKAIKKAGYFLKLLFFLNKILFLVLKSLRKYKKR